MGCAQIIPQLAVAAILAGLGAGCHTAPPESDPNRAPARQQPPGPSAKAPPAEVVSRPHPHLPKSFYVLRQVDHQGTQPGPNRLVTTYQIQFEYPEFQHPEFSELNQIIFEWVRTKRTRMMDLAGFLDEETLRSPSLPWHAILTFKINWATNDFVSLHLEYNESTSPTNELTTILTLNYDAQDGDCLSLDYCLASQDALQTLSNMARQALIDHLGNQADESLIEQGTRPSWDNYQCFLITPDQLVLLFTPGRVAGYNAGVQEVAFNWQDIHKLLSPEFENYLDNIDAPPPTPE